MRAKTVQELDKIIDSAPEKKVRMALKQIAYQWWGVGDQLDFNKELNSDTLEAVTSILHINGFCPKEN
jgi:hypothetical protein